MNIHTGLLSIALLALGPACTVQNVARVEAPPPLPPRQAPNEQQAVRPIDEQATERWLEQRTGRRLAAPTELPVSTTDEEATRAFLQERIEQQRAVNPERAPEPVYQYIERPQEPQPIGYDASGWPVHRDAYGGPVYYRDPCPPSTFPVNTLLGAGVGAIIGHQNGRRESGALIGGGVGMLLDLFRWY